MQRKLTWEYITLMPWLPRSRGRWEPDVDVHRAREHRAAKPNISGLGACLQRLAQHAEAAARCRWQRLKEAEALDRRDETTAGRPLDGLLGCLGLRPSSIKTRRRSWQQGGEGTLNEGMVRSIDNSKHQRNEGRYEINFTTDSCHK
jgi:hypothetical protein